MIRHVRIIEKEVRPSFINRLESRARTMTDRLERNSWDQSLSSGLERKIALTLNQVDCVRNVHKKLRLDLLRTECRIDTEIMQREPRDPVYEDPRLPERDMLKARLLKIERELPE